MIVLQFLVDPVKIKEALEEDNIYQNIFDVKSIDNLDTVFANLDLYKFFYIKDNELTIGILILKMFASNCYSFHGGIYKPYRGKDTPKNILTCLSILKYIDPQVQFMTTINSKNKLAIRLLHSMKFIHKTTIKKATLENDDILIFAEQ